jgi:excisionase family DNA binding protein
VSALESLPQYLTVQQYAKLMQIPPSTARTLARQGHGGAFKVGRKWRFPRDLVGCSMQAVDSAEKVVRRLNPGRSK